MLLVHLFINYFGLLWIILWIILTLTNIEYQFNTKKIINLNNNVTLC